MKTRRFNGQVHRIVAAAGAIAVGIAATGCSAPLSEVPGVGSNSDTYPIHIQFSNVLNLPSGAPVSANGVRVGTLDGLHIAPEGYVIADIGIDDGVSIPVGTTASLEQPAPLADVHIALDTAAAAPDAGVLAAGETIRLADTSEAPQIEDTLSGLATAVGNGTFDNFLTTVREVNRAFPDDPRSTSRTFAALGSNLDDLADHQESLDAVLDGLTQTTDTVIEERDIIDSLLSTEGVTHTTDAMSSIVGILFILTDLGQIAPPSTWLVPMVSSMDNAVRAIVPPLFGPNPLDTTKPSNLRKLNDLIQNELIPFVSSGARVDVTSVTVGEGPTLSASTQSAEIITLMRMIGLVR